MLSKKEGNIMINFEPQSLQETFNAIEKLAPSIKDKPGYFKYDFKAANYLADWTERFQKLAKKLYQKTGHVTFTDFDTETTGLVSSKMFASGEAGVTDVAGVQIIDYEYCGSQVDPDGYQHNDKTNPHEYQSLMNPGVPLPDEVVEVTHITNEMVQHAPSQYEALLEFKRFSNNTILVGHNIGDSLQRKNGYDLTTVLEPIYHRYFNQQIGSLRENAVDALPLFKGLIAGTDHTNASFAKMFGYPLQGAHRAIADTRANTIAFCNLLPILYRLDVKALRAYAKQLAAGHQFEISYIRPGAKIEHNKQHNWIEFGLKLDPQFRTGRKLPRARLKYDLATNKFDFDHIDLKNVQQSSYKLRKSMPIKELKRRAKVKLWADNWKQVLAQQIEVVF